MVEGLRGIELLEQVQYSDFPREMCQKAAALVDTHFGEDYGTVQCGGRLGWGGVGRHGAAWRNVRNGKAAARESPSCACDVLRLGT